MMPLPRRSRAVSWHILDFPQDTTVGDGKEALDYLLAAAEDELQRKPDIISMCPELPVIDGFECSRILRCKFPYSNYYCRTPIVGMPYRPIVDDKERRRTTGMSGILPRPIQERNLEQIWSNGLSKVELESLFSESNVRDAGRDASNDGDGIVQRLLKIEASTLGQNG
ncbi:hypothetical protein MFIFM68171_06332 [Madurella fahalii]|uniref:Response regulatory domain-containing protein n=1 Tax=Madurella fahalii TaxID=1157608 RepID=A0ABQ0GEF7_9PEZI